MTDLSGTMESIKQLVAQNKKDEAVKLIFYLIVGYAEKKDFINAELLRNKLIEVDPMALNEIIQTAEIIEEKKKASIAENHMTIWSGLYNKVSQEEANLLYYAMKPCTFNTNEFVFKQGQRNTRLYFINHGRLKITWLQNNYEYLLKSLNPGDIAGQDTFFSNSVCTTSLITLSPVNMRYLRQETVLQWKNERSALEAKLREYCFKDSLNIQELLHKKALDRRTQSRHNMEGTVVAQLLDVSGNLAGRAVKADLADISNGGLSFAMHIPKPETARLLLGRKINLQFIVSTRGDQQKMGKMGMVVGVCSHPFDEYTIHVKFDKA